METKNECFKDIYVTSRRCYSVPSNLFKESWFSHHFLAFKPRCMLSGVQRQLPASSNFDLVQNLHAKPNKLKLPSVFHCFTDGWRIWMFFLAHFKMELWDSILTAKFLSVRFVLIACDVYSLIIAVIWFLFLNPLCKPFESLLVQTSLASAKGCPAARIRARMPVATLQRHVCLPPLSQQRQLGSMELNGKRLGHLHRKQLTGQCPSLRPSRRQSQKPNEGLVERPKIMPIMPETLVKCLPWLYVTMWFKSYYWQGSFSHIIFHFSSHKCMFLGRAERWLNQGQTSHLTPCLKQSWQGWLFPICGSLLEIPH